MRTSSILASARSVTAAALLAAAATGGSARLAAAARPAPGVRIWPEAPASLPADSLFPTVFLSGSWAADGHRVLAGSRRHGAAAQHYLLISLDTRARLGVRRRYRAEAYLSFLDHGGPGIGAYVGDVQGVSNIEAAPAARLYEGWMEVTLPGEGVALLAGLYDLNRDFYALETSKLFLNSSHGIGPEFGLSGEGGPSIYPYTSLGIRASAKAAPGLVLRAALLDATPGAPGNPAAWGISLRKEEGALVAGEADLARPGGAPVRVAVGAWAYTAPFSIEGERAGALGNRGAYALAEGDVTPCGGGRCVRAFVRAGRSSRRVNPVAASLGAGVVVEARAGGPALGVAWASARTGGAGPVPAGHSCGAEGNLEVTARVPVVAGLEVLPDIQMIRAPGMDRASPRAVVASVRVSLSF